MRFARLRIFSNQLFDNVAMLENLESRTPVPVPGQGVNCGRVLPARLTNAFNTKKNEQE